MILQTDASKLGMAAVLYQESGTPEDRHVISYASARFSHAETRYHANEQECLAVVWGIKRYRPYLEDKKFLLRTDSRVLTWLNNSKDDRAKLTRWSILLQGFDFEVEHVPGKLNLLPDFLSRAPAPLREEVDIPSEDLMLPPEANVIEAVTLADEVEEAQKTDATTQRFLRLLGGAEEDELRRTYDAQQGVLYFKRDRTRKIYVADSIRERVLYDHHDSADAGHPGIEETTRAINESFHWPSMTRDIKLYVKRCLICAKFKRKPRHQLAGLRPRHPTRPFETLAIDLMGPYPGSRYGNRQILVITDLFTRWVEAFAIPSAAVEILVRLISDEVFARFGYPREIISDNGPQFQSPEWTEQCRLWRVLHWTTADYHPRANPTERRNQELKKGLRIRLDEQEPRRWDEMLPSTLASIRRRANAGTGKTPSQLLFGQNNLAPGGWAAPIPDREEQADIADEARRHQGAYIARRYGLPVPAVPQLEPGDRVLIRNFQPRHAFEPRWMGPYQVVRANGPNHYIIRINRRMRKYHIDDIRVAPPIGPGRVLA